MKLIQTLILAAFAIASAPALAQWQWLDKDGRKVFSDRAPPPDVPDRNILKRPGEALRISDDRAAPVPAGTATSAPAAVQSTGQDKELSAKRKQAAEAEAAKRQQETERTAAARAETCERARRTKAGLDAGQRATRLNDKGEREFLDEAGVAAETQRLQGIINESCN